MKLTGHIRDARGYVLFLVAGVIAAISLGLLAVARVQEDVAPGLLLLREDVEHEIDAQTAVGHAAFLLLSEPIGPRSIVVGGAREVAMQAAPSGQRLRSASGQLLREVVLDGRPYRLQLDQNGRTGASLGLQDENGLLDLNLAGGDAVTGLLVDLGVRRQSAQVLAARLADYLDQDDLTRANGAEKDAYRAVGRPPPPNRALAHRWQVLDVLGWPQMTTPEQLDAFWRYTSVGAGVRGVNVNTAPLPVLRAIVGDPRRVQSLERRRALSPIATQDEIEGLAGVNTRPDGAVLAAQPGSRFRLVVGFDQAATGRKRSVESQIELPRADADRPFYWRDGWHDVAGDSNVQGNRGVREVLPEGASLRAP